MNWLDIELMSYVDEIVETRERLEQIRDIRDTYYAVGNPLTHAAMTESMDLCYDKLKRLDQWIRERAESTTKPRGASPEPQ